MASPRHRPGWWPWALWALSVVLVAIGGILLFASKDVPYPTPWGFRGYPAVMALPFATVGAIVASRRPENPIGWLLCAVGLISATQMLVEEYGVFASLRSSSHQVAQLAEWLGHWLWLPAAALLSTALLIFPSGRPLSAGWGRVRWLTVAGVAAAFAGFVVGSPEAFQMSGANPLAVPGLGDEAVIASDIGLGLVFAGLTLAAVSIFVRTRRSKGEERLQLKWLVLAAALVPISNLIATLEVPAFVQNIAVCGLTAFPIAMGVAVLKYRLYEIDRVINRTLVYAGLTGVLAVIYLGIVVVLQQALKGFTEGSSIAVAGSTLAVAALFSPLRARIQRFIDARFYRSKYDAQRTIEAFAATLRHEVDLDALMAQLSAAVQGTVEPAQASVWLRVPAARADGDPSPPPSTRDLNVPTTPA